MKKFDSNDIKYMKLALELAAKGEGYVNPNPLVGAVVVEEEKSNNVKVIGTGYHKFYGGPHAEVYALDEALNFKKKLSTKLDSATLYVTLEPCSHYGKTPPCAKKIIESGIKRCVIATLDPNPIVSGKGVEMLKKAGINVEIGLLKKEAEIQNKIFIKYIKTKVPYLFLKCGITLDGKIATKTGDSKWITNELSRGKVQKLRHKFMGIMVGIGTLLADNPSLTTRLETKDGIDPYRIVIDPWLEVSLDSKFATYEDGKSIIVLSKEFQDKDKLNCTEQKYYLQKSHDVSEKNIREKIIKNCKKIEKLKKNNITFIFLEIDLNKDSKFKISDILIKLGKLGLDSILLEGGKTLISNAFKENVIDGGEIFIAPKIIGDKDAIPFIEGFQISKISNSIELENTEMKIYGNNISITFGR